MDSLGSAPHSLIFRAGDSSGRHRDENLVPMKFRKMLITPQGRIKGMIKIMIEQLEMGKLTAAAAMRLLGVLRKVVAGEKAIVGEQLLARRDRPEAASLRCMAAGVMRFAEGVDNCMAALHEGTAQDFREAAADLENRIGEHEKMMEAMVSSSETEGWLLLQRFRGPFSPVLGVLGWGITAYLAGTIPERNFRRVLDLIESELETRMASYKPNLFFLLSWKQAEKETRGAFQLVRAALFNRETMSSGIIDPTSLRGALGTLARALCHLNIMAASLHPEKAKEGKAFDARLLVLVKRSNASRHILSVPSDFYPKANRPCAN